MSPLADVFIAGRRRQLFLAALWGAFFIVFLGVGWGFVLWQIGNHARRDRHAELDRISEIHSSAVTSLRTLTRSASGAPCSPQFVATMRSIAFLPDGLNEFLHAPDGMVTCSTSRSAFVRPVPLGPPDIPRAGPNALRLWIDRELTALGRPGTTGTIVALGDFAVVIPPHTRFGSGLSWLEKELVVVGPKGKTWNVAGADGVYRRVAETGSSGLLSQLFTIHGITCDDAGLYCVASRAQLVSWAQEWMAIPTLIAVLAALGALGCGSYVVGWLTRYWSFEARFSRNLENVIVAYQPIIDLRSDKVMGCEVLARWRDVDGTIVEPESFIGIVEKTGRTLEFTRIVVDRAYEELSEQVPKDIKLQVGFNVFGNDLNSATLMPIFAKFEPCKRQFEVAVELVESQEIDLDDAQRAILDLRRAGLKVYIDDFGIGYSSIQRVATLAVDGVKLDRSFAMAHPDSVLGRMIVQVLEMIKVSGRLIVVEGVETQDRLDLLRAIGRVDYVQGLAVAGPLDIDEFVSFLAAAEEAGKPRGFAA